MEDETLCLIKFGDRVHLEALMNEGAMYFQTIEHFQKLEADALRGDPSEGLSKVFQSALAEVTFTTDDGRKFEFSGKKGTLINTVRMSTNYVTGLHAFCMYAVTSTNSSSYHVDERVRSGFGDTCVAILNFPAFIDRVQSAVKAAGVGPLEADLVEYMDRDVHTGDMGAFRKYRAFEYQSEYRITVATGFKGPWTLKIGPLHGIAEIGEAARVNEALTLAANLLPP